MIDNKSIQRALAVLTFYQGPIDGIIGPMARDAITAALTKHLGSTAANKWSEPKKVIAFQQLILYHAGLYTGKMDGMWGPLSRHALELWQNRLRDIPSEPLPPKADSVVIKQGDPIPTKWPSQSEVPRYYGPMGQNQVTIKTPYQLYLYDTKTKVSGISCHTKVAGSLERILVNVKDAYSPSAINDLHLNRFFGCMNVRKMRGGSSWSMHSWGIAIDWDANRNQLRWGRDQAAFAKSAYDEWWKAWEDEGWLSLGRERNYDYMHVQAARL